MARRKRTRGALPRTEPPTGHTLFEDFLPHLIAWLAYKLDVDLHEKLRRRRINVTRWRVLAVLAMADGITINELVERAMTKQSALSRVLKKMESEGLVRRVPRSDDARYVEVFLCPLGRKLFDELNVVVSARQERLLEGFSRQETTDALALMRRLTRNLER
jgi:DNA-binding MarR family transcriptional regulator